MKKKKLEIDPEQELSDIALCSCSLAARGLWSYIRLIMARSSPYGSLLIKNSPVKPEQLARMVGEGLEITIKLLEELIGVGIICLEKGTYISRQMILDESIRDKRRAGGASGGNPVLIKNPTKSKVPKGKDKQKVKPPDNLNTGEWHETYKLAQHYKIYKEPEIVNKPTENEEKNDNNEVKHEVNLPPQNPHESSKKADEKKSEFSPCPLYIIFSINSLIKENEDIEGVWGKKTWNAKLRNSILNEVAEKEVREYLSQDIELLRAFLDFEHMRKTMKKPCPMTARAAKMIITELKKLSNNDLTLSIKLLDQSIVESWKDIYPLKNKNKLQTNTPNDFSSAANKFVG